MTEELRETQQFEGRKVDGRELKLSGSLAQSANLDEAHQIDDEFVVIGVYRLDKVTHKLHPKAGFLRIEGAKAIELHIVDGSTDALSVLHEARAADQAAIDALLGRSPLPFNDDAQVTDEGLHRLIDAETGEITTGPLTREDMPEGYEDIVPEGMTVTISTPGTEDDPDYEQQLRDAIATPIAKPAPDPDEETGIPTVGSGPFWGTNRTRAVSIWGCRFFATLPVPLRTMLRIGGRRCHLSSARLVSRGAASASWTNTGPLGRLSALP